MKKLIIFLTLNLLGLNLFAQFSSIPTPNILDSDQNLVPASQTINLGCGLNSYEVEAIYPDVGNTSEYKIEPATFFQFGAPRPSEIAAGTAGLITSIVSDNNGNPQDDVWGNTDVFLSDDPAGNPFDFCFFGNEYNNITIGTNSIVSFNTTTTFGLPTTHPYIYGGEYCTWPLNAADKIGTTGNDNLFRNAIFFPYHDIDINIGVFDGAGNQINDFYWRILGNAPDRIVVIGVLDNNLFDTDHCGSLKASHEIFLYETTNIIEIHVGEKPYCNGTSGHGNPPNGWNDGLAVMGIQNGSPTDPPTLGYTPKNRDMGVWEAYNEAHRFVPTGGINRPVLTWYKNYNFVTDTGTIIDATDVDSSSILDPNNPIQYFAPTVTTTYTCQVAYTVDCASPTKTVLSTKSFTLIVDNLNTGEIVDNNPPNDPVNDIFLCANTGGTFTVFADVTNTAPGGSVTYTWQQTTPDNVTVVVGNTDTYIIDSAAIAATGFNTAVYECIMELKDAANTLICTIADEVNVIIGNPSFSYTNASFCSTAAGNDTTPQNAVPLTSTNLGTFSINNGGVFVDTGTGSNSLTGEIDLTASGLGLDSTGDFVVTYTVGILPNACSANVNVNIVTGDASFSYPSITVCINDGTATPDPASINTPGGEFTINNGGVIDINTGVVDLTASGDGVFTINYDITNLGTTCSGNTNFTLIITAQDDTAFGYDVDNDLTETSEDFCVSNSTSGLPNPAPLTTGGTYTISAPGIINATTGVIDFALTPATNTPYTITYTTTGSCANSSQFNITLHPDESANFIYLNLFYCNTDANPTVNITGTPGGIFEINNGGVFVDSGTSLNSLTGEIDLAAIPNNGLGTDSTGTFTIKYTTPGTFCSAFSTYNITVNATPIIDISVIPNPLEVCGPYTLPPFQGTNLTNNISYYDMPGGPTGGGTTYTVNDVINFDSTATYPITLYIYDETGTTPNCFDEKSFMLTINPKPNIDISTIPNPLEVCNRYTLPAFVGTNLTNNISYYDMPGGPTGGGTAYTIGDVINFDSTATYPITLYIYDETGPNCFDEKSFMLTINAKPNIDISAIPNPLEICGPYTLPAFAGTNLTNNISYYDMPGGPTGGGTAYTIGDVINFDSTATYPITLYIYDETGTTPNCFDEKSFTLTINVTPNIDISAIPNPLEVCDSYTLPAFAGTNLTNNISYYDMPGGPTGGGTAYMVNDVINFDSTATYPITLYIYDETGTTTNCFDEKSFTLTINVTPNIDISAIPNPLEVCDSYTLPTIVGTNLTGNEMYYTESNGLGTAYAANTTLNYNDFSTYPVTLYIFDTIGSIGNECTSQENFTLNIVPTDDPTFTYNPNTCLSNTNPIPTSIATPGGTFSIDNGAIINPNTGEVELTSVIGDTTYQITYITNGVCPDTSSISIIIDDIVDASIAFVDEIICIDDTNPQAIITGDLGGIFSIDQNAVINTNTGVINLSSTIGGTTYTITYTVDNGTCSDTQTAEITINGLPEFEVPDQAYICPTANIDTEIMVTNALGNYTYEWYDPNGLLVEIGDTLTLNDPAQTGIYTVTATVATGDPTLFCTASTLVAVGLAEQVIITNVFINDFNRPNNTISIEVQGGTGDFTYILTDTNGNEISQNNNPIFENLLSDNYQITILDNQGCSEAVYKNDVIVLDYPPFFSPNNDGRYDTWNINNANFIPNSKIYIFDRFGRVLAQIDPNGSGWNGHYLGKQLPADDYWFTVAYIDPNTHLPKTVKGHFSIVRKGEI